MADRSVVVRLRAEIGNFKAGMAEGEAAARRTGKAAEDAAKRADTAMGRLGKSMTQNASDWDRVGNAATVGGAAVAAGLGLATKASIDWESAWAGVTKTVDGTPAQMAQIEQGLRGLARELPATQSEIAGVAEAAGQLGVKRADILGFTKTMIGLGESTNLTADEAATAIAQISNVMGTMDRDGAQGVERFGSALVQLGNNGASTERDIVSMASRIAGAAKVVGMSESDLLGISNALASVGVEAEAGGTAVSNVLMDMSKAVKTGSDDLDGFARVAGMSASDFAKAFEESPARAMAAFTTGLGRIKDTGGDVFTTLDELGQSDVRVSSALLKMAGAGDLLTESLDQGAQAWESNTALQDEAAKRYATTASQLKIAQNTARDAAIDLGSVLAPAVADVAGAFADLAGFIADLPPGVQQAAVGVAGFGGASLLAVGGTIKLVRAGVELSESLDRISTKGPRAAKGVNAATTATKGLAKGLAAVGVAVAASRILDGDNAAYGVEKLTNDILTADDAFAGFNDRLAQNAKISGMSDSPVRSVGDALRIAFDPSFLEKANDSLGSVTAALGFGNRSEVQTSLDALQQIDSALAGLVSNGNPEKAADVFGQLADMAAKNGVSVDELKAKLPGYSEALAAGANAAVQATDGSKGLATGLDAAGGSAEAAAEKISEAASAIEELGSAMLGQRGSARDFEAAVDAAAEAVEKNGRNLKIGTQAGRDNQAALDAIASATTNYAAKALEAGESAQTVAGIVSRGREQFIQAAEAMGMAAPKAEALANQLGLIPDDVSAMVSTPGMEQALTDSANLKSSLTELPKSTEPQVLAPGAVQAWRETEQLKSSLFTVPKETAPKVLAPGAVQAWQETERVKSSLFTVPKQTNGNVATPGATIAADQAATVMRRLLDIPGSTTARLTVTGADQGIAKANELIRTINRITGKTVYVNVVNRQMGSGAGASIRGGQVKGAATGGAIYGPGTGTSDSIDAKLSNGEHVWTAAEVDAAGGQAAMYRARGLVRSGALKFAKGGAVGDAAGFADGGEVDFAGIFDLIRDVTDWQDVTDSRKTRSSRATAVTAAINALRSLQAQQRKAARDLAAARKATRGGTSASRAAAARRVNDLLDRQRLLLGKVAAAEGKVTAARKASADAVKATARVEAEYRADRAPLIDRTIKAAGSTNRVTKTFLDNIEKLNRMGFRTLALQLLEQGGPEAETLAAQAVGSVSKARSLQSSFATSASLDARSAQLLASLQGQPAVNLATLLKPLMVQGAPGPSGGRATGGDTYILNGVKYDAAGDVAGALSFARRSQRNAGAYGAN